MTATIRNPRRWWRKPKLLALLSSLAHGSHGFLTYESMLSALLVNVSNVEDVLNVRANIDMKGSLDSICVRFQASISSYVRIVVVVARATFPNTTFSTAALWWLAWLSISFGCPPSVWTWLCFLCICVVGYVVRVCVCVNDSCVVCTWTRNTLMWPCFHRPSLLARHGCCLQDWEFMFVVTATDSVESWCYFCLAWRYFYKNRMKWHMFCILREI